jgi:hypothetical protein
MESSRNNNHIHARFDNNNNINIQQTKHRSKIIKQQTIDEPKIDGEQHAERGNRRADALVDGAQLALVPHICQNMCRRTIPNMS